MALSLDTPRAYELGETNTLPVRASTCIYEGAAVGDDGSGYARGLEAGDEFRGFCIKQADNSATATNGAINVQVRSTGKAQLAVTSLAITDVGAQVFASDDATFTLDSNNGTNSYIGTVYRYVSAGVGIVSFAAKGDRDDESVTLGMMVDLARGSIITGNTSNRPTALAAETSGQILVGDGNDLKSVAVTGDVTISEEGVTAIGEGKVDQRQTDNTHTYETFNCAPIVQQISTTAGTASDGTDEDTMAMCCGRNMFEFFNIGTQTLLAPTIAADGLLCSLDLTSGKGVEYTQGITARSKSAFKIGADGAFYLKIGLKVADVSGVAECAVGFRKEAAYDATIDDYTDMAVLNLQGGDIKIETILNGDGDDTVATDTTNDWADTEEHVLEVYVSEAGVASYKIDGEAPKKVPATAFTFDTGDTVIPFFHLIHGTDPGAIHLQLWECGLQ